MTKTKEELRQALTLCASEYSQCHECPYWSPMDTHCLREIVRDAKERIMELEAAGKERAE